MRNKRILFVIGLSILLACMIRAGLYYKYDYFPHKESYEILDFALIAQPDGISCGPTSAQMVLDHYGIEVPLKELKSLAKTEMFAGSINDKKIEIGCTIPDHLKKALIKSGLDVELKRGRSLDEIKFHVDQNKPIITLVRSGRNLWHYFVVIGYNKDSMLIADPSGGERYYIANEKFLGAWNYSTDLDGDEMNAACPFCDGKGHYKHLPKPLGNCDMCGSTGEVGDYWLGLYSMLSNCPNFTIIVPKNGASIQSDQ